MTVLHWCEITYMAHKRYDLYKWHTLITNWEKTSIDRGRTERISLTHDLDLDLHVSPWPSIPCKLWSWPTHKQKFKVNGQSVPKIEWKQTDARTDGRTEAITLPRSLMNNSCCPSYAWTCMWSSWCHCHTIISASTKIQKGLSFWYWSTWIFLKNVG